MKAFKNWLSRLRYVFHRHQWLESHRFIRRYDNGRIVTYFFAYRCVGCHAEYEHATEAGMIWVALKGKTREGLTYIPNMGYWRMEEGR